MAQNDESEREREGEERGKWKTACRKSCDVYTDEKSAALFV